MDTVVEKFNVIVRDVTRLTSDFSPTTWAVVAVGTVIFGYVMLKGMNLQRR